MTDTTTVRRSPPKSSMLLGLKPVMSPNDSSASASSSHTDCRRTAGGRRRPTCDPTKPTATAPNVRSVGVIVRVIDRMRPMPNTGPPIMAARAPRRIGGRSGR